MKLYHVLSICYALRIIHGEEPHADGNFSSPDQGDKLNGICGTDIIQNCAATDNFWTLYCLYSKKDSLSEECRNYLGKTTVGGCNRESQQLCPTATSDDDIIKCLETNLAKLSKECLYNVQNRKSVNNRLQEANQQLLRITLIVTVLSVVYLSIPLAIGLWAWIMMIYFNVEQHQVLAEDKSLWKYENERMLLDGSRSEGAKAKIGWEIGFYKLSYSIYEIKNEENVWKKTKKHILHEVTGRLQPSTITAIMGPSGSGKTTLLKLLGGQTNSGLIRGIRLLNGQIKQPRIYDEMLGRQGFVQQQDLLFENLTVWQTLHYAAMLRLPENLSNRTKLRRAALMMHEFGLSAVAHCMVGSGLVGDSRSNAESGLESCMRTLGIWDSNPSARVSISGGQRRRLSIAIELLGQPSFLCLDEPTSGLDSGNSLKIVKSLRRLCKKSNTTIVLTIHQPRSEVFSLFDGLILLASGGHLVYAGPTSEASQLLSTAPSVNLSIREHDNPGDFIIDILGLDESPIDTMKSPSTSLYHNNSMDNCSSSSSEEQSSFINTSSNQRLLSESQEAIGDPSRIEDVEIGSNNTLAEVKGPEPNLVMHSSIPSFEYFKFMWLFLIQFSSPMIIYLQEVWNGVQNQPHPQTFEEDDDEYGTTFQSFEEWQSHEISKLQSKETANSHSPSHTIAQELSFHFQISQQFYDLRNVLISQMTKHGTNPNYEDPNGFRSSEDTFGASDSIDSSDVSPDKNELSNAYNSVITSRISSILQLTTTDYQKLNTNSTHEVEMVSFTSSNDKNPPPQRKQDASLKKTKKKGFHRMPSVMGYPDINDEAFSNAIVSSSTSQVWILFSRRLQAFAPSPQDFMVLVLQIVLVGSIVSITFTYSISSEMEKPYQILMLLFLVSNYAMILQYLILIPEYMTERKIILNENSSGKIGYGSYIFSAMLTEIPMAVTQSLLLIGIVYLIHPLNPEPINIAFCITCLMVGVCSWQSLICMCAVITDNIGLAYTFSFLILGSGALFGGLLVRLNKIPSYFRFLYYVSVAALTQRALITNDMQCCYLSANCNSIAKDFQSSNPNQFDTPLTFDISSNNSLEMNGFCPPGLQFTGDGSDAGNLGRLYLTMMGLQEDRPFVSLLVLFWANILFRIAAIGILYFKKYLRYNLIDESVGKQIK